jgi:hypothetical protein
MKQYWRIGTIRVISSLILGMLVLGRLYYVYVPGLNNMGLLGALALGSILILLFMSLGWAYDVKARMWSQQIQALTERSAYEYVSNYKTYALDYPVFCAILQTLRNIFEKVNIETESINDSLRYFENYFVRSIKRQDLVAAMPAAKEFMKTHPFSDSSEMTQRKAGLGARAKLTFHVHMLRFTWIQSLTGLLQEVLIVGAIYAIVFYYEGTDVIGGIVPIEYLVQGILFISLPLFVLLASLGWIYDKKLRIWSPDIMVKVERNPFMYVAEPKMHIMVLPLFIAILGTLGEVLVAAGIEDNEINRILHYISDYSNLDVSRDGDMEKVRSLRSSYGELFQYPREGA